MDITGIIDRVKYEDYLKKIYEIYPKLSADSRTAKIIKAIELHAPCSWKVIQGEAFKDKYENKNITCEEWQKIHGNGYGLDLFYKICRYFTKSYKDPADRRRTLYELNEFGMAFSYCFDNLYTKTVSKDNPAFLKILESYGKKLEDIESYGETGFNFDWENYIRKITKAEPFRKIDMANFVKYYKYAKKNPDKGFIEYIDDCLIVTIKYENCTVRRVLEFKSVENQKYLTY